MEDPGYLIQSKYVKFLIPLFFWFGIPFIVLKFFVGKTTEFSLEVAVCVLGMAVLMGAVIPFGLPWLISKFSKKK